MAFKSVCRLTLLLFLFHPRPAGAQDTLVINQDQARALFLKQNLQLLAVHYDLKTSEAEMLQARAWNNPYFNWNQDLYSVEKNQYFNYRNQFLVQVDLAFSIAGKYTQTVKLAKLNHKGNQLIVQDLLRALNYDLSLKFQDVLLLQKKLALLGEVVETYNKVIDAAEVQNRIGALSNKELIRLRTEVYEVQTEFSVNTSSLLEAKGQLRMLLNIRPDVEIIALDGVERESTLPTISELIEFSEQYRADYQLAKNQIEQGAVQVRLQKAKSVPDITFGYQPKDRGSNYVRPYSGIEVGMELPIFHRNQGNIQAAQAQYSKTLIELERKQNELFNEVHSAFKVFLENRGADQRFSSNVMKEVSQLNENAEMNYLKKNINILEYIDMKRIFIQNRMHALEARSRYVNAANRLNFVVGKEITQ
jgi:cobalt-zinc-cadmium efflux system outer membrane protein